MDQHLSIIVTGAAGMIGSAIVRHLNDRGFENLLLVDDIKKSDKWKNLLGKKFVNIVSRYALWDYLENRAGEIGAIIHMGACSDTEERDGDYLLENNFRYSVRLATWALNHQKKLIYASSAATYGDGKEGFSDDEARLEVLRPLNMYGFSKHLFDLWMKREGGWKTAVGLKFFNVFGPNEYHKGRMASMVLKMVNKVRVEGVVQLYQSNDSRFAHGEQCRDFIYVKDVARMTCNFLDSSAGGLYNIGRGVPTTWNQLALALFRALDRKENIEYIPMAPELSLQYQNYTCADMRKFADRFPHFQTTVIPNAVYEYVRDYLLSNSRW